MILSLFNQAILVLFIIGASTFSIYLQTTVDNLKKLDFLTIYACVLGCIVMASFFFLNVAAFFKIHSVLNIALSCLIGVLGGIVATWSDRSIIRNANRRLAQQFHAAKQKLKPVKKTSTWGKSSKAKFPPLAVILLIAAFEEILFRGVLVQLCCQAERQLVKGLCWVSITVLFSIIHIQIRWANVLAKLPLGIITLLTVIAFQSIISAIIVHVVFNALVWRDLKNSSEHQVIINY